MNYAEMKRVLSLTDDAVMRLEMVMDFGARLYVPPETAKCYDISGCASAVQICVDGNRFYGRADSALVRGIVAILIAMVDGMGAEQIKNMDIDSEFRSLNLNLGAGRLSGLESMISFFKNL